MNDDTPPVGGNDPSVIIAAGIGALNAVLTAVFAFLTLDPGQAAALYGLSNPLGVLALALWTRGRSVTVHPLPAPEHGYNPELHED